MPTSTFYNLRNEKKQRIVNAIKKEINRAPFNEMSVKNIVVDAKIARGSFYQYFESREDLINYFIEEELNKDKEVLSKFYVENNRDVFETIYKYAEITTLREKENMDYYFHIMEYVREYELNFNVKFKPEDMFANTILDMADNKKEKFLTLVKILSIIIHYEKMAIFSGCEDRATGLKELRKKIDFLKLAYESSIN